MLPPFDPWRTSLAMFDVAGAGLADEGALATLRAGRLVALLEAARKSPLYREILGRRAPSSMVLEDLPVSRKCELMDRFDEWVADPALHLDALRRFVADTGSLGEPFMGRFYVWESSGSCGEPGIFVQDAAAMAVYDALEALRRPHPPALPSLIDPTGCGEPWGRMAFVGATNGHFASTLSVERLRRLNPLLAPCLHTVSFLQPLADMRAELEALQPRIVATYPSVAILLAEEKLAGRLPIAPQQVWTGGETLTPAMRLMIAQAFGCKVVNNYGASEFMSLACECEHGSLHLNSDWAILEPVDEQGRPVPPGRAGATTLLTNLANHVQPIIRYDLGDRVAIHAQGCACGSHLPVITVHGRSGDLMRLGRPGSRDEARVSGLALSTVLESVEGLADFQLIQHAGDELELRTEQCGPLVNGTLRRARSALAHYLDSQGASYVRIRCHCNCPSRRERNGKVQRVIAMGSVT